MLADVCAKVLGALKAEKRKHYLVFELPPLVEVQLVGVAQGAQSLLDVGRSDRILNDFWQLCETFLKFLFY